VQKERRVIGSIIDYRFGPDDPAGLLELLTDPTIRIVSLTVTEGGYNVNPVTGEFITDEPRSLRTPRRCGPVGCRRRSSGMSLPR
jgi:mannitol-1-phosphate/altronate dehydrogenase